MTPLQASSRRSTARLALPCAFAALLASAAVARAADVHPASPAANAASAAKPASPAQGPAAAPTSLAADPTLPKDSAYQLYVALEDQDGRRLHFADGRGRPRLVSLFYTSCQYVCPLIVDTLKKTEAALTPAQRAGLDVLLVSLDPETDTPAALRRVADQRHLDTPRWRLARTDKAHVRQLAAVLGIQYKQIEARDFSHSSAIVLLDAEGRIVARSETMGTVDAALLAKAQALLAPP